MAVEALSRPKKIVKIGRFTTTPYQSRSSAHLTKTGPRGRLDGRILKIVDCLPVLRLWWPGHGLVVVGRMRLAAIISLVNLCACALVHGPAACGRAVIRLSKSRPNMPLQKACLYGLHRL